MQNGLRLWQLRLCVERQQFLIIIPAISCSAVRDMVSMLPFKKKHGLCSSSLNSDSMMLSSDIELHQLLFFGAFPNSQSRKAFRHPPQTLSSSFSMVDV